MLSLNIQGVSSFLGLLKVSVTLVGVVMSLNSEQKTQLYGYPGKAMLYINTGFLKTPSLLATFSTFELVF